MFGYKVTIFIFITAFIFAPVYGQDKSQSHQAKIISGTVSKVDFVGNIITIQTQDLGQGQMAFFVPSNAIITEEAKDIGLMDIRESDPVTIQYNVLSPGKYITVSITDKKPDAIP